MTTRWIALPSSIGSAIEYADLTAEGRCAWLALRIAHAAHGLGGAIPARIASPRGLPLAAPAVLAGLDVPAALAELRKAGLIQDDGDDVLLTDWSPETEQAPCSSCRRRNPDPRHGRCPSCRARDTDPGRRTSRKRGADVAQTDRDDGEGGPRPGLYSTHSTDSTRITRRARTREAPAAHQTPARPAGEPIPAAPAAAAPAAAPTAFDVSLVITAWVQAHGRQTLTAADRPAVARLLEQLGPTPEITGRDRERRVAALLADRDRLAERVIRWCPSAERLARWLRRAHRWFGVANLAAYLRRAAERGDPGTLLEGGTRDRYGRGADDLQDFSPQVERSLVGEHQADVAKIVAGTAAVLTTVDDGQREVYRRQLRLLLTAGNLVGAGRVLLLVVGDAPSDVDLARFVADTCDLETARAALKAVAA